MDRTDEIPTTSENMHHPPLVPAPELTDGEEIPPPEKFQLAPPLSTEPVPQDVSSFGGG